jgi:2-iminobutanoate/2-iminopropanoate deaminase
MKKIINTKKAPSPIGPYSQAVVAGNFLFISGQIPIVPESGNIVGQGIQEQTKQIMENIKEILAKAGTNFDSVVKSTLFIRDMREFKIINEIYGSYFSKSPPARETVEVSKLPRNVRIEISAIADIS